MIGAAIILLVLVFAVLFAIFLQHERKGNKDGRRQDNSNAVIGH